MIAGLPGPLLGRVAPSGSHEVPRSAVVYPGGGNGMGPHAHPASSLVRCAGRTFTRWFTVPISSGTPNAPPVPVRGPKRGQLAERRAR